jgi:hypothetical protein
MIAMAVDARHRDKNGEISRKHGNTLIRTLRPRKGPWQRYPARGCGGGFSSTMASTCPSTSASANSAASTGTAPPLSSMGTNSNFTLNGGTIPLGSTEIDGAGVSPLITVP